MEPIGNTRTGDGMFRFMKQNDPSLIIVGQPMRASDEKATRDATLDENETPISNLRLDIGCQKKKWTLGISCSFTQSRHLEKMT